MTPIHPDNLDLVWDDVLSYIRSGLEYCRHKYSVENVKNFIVDGTITLWLIYNDRGNIGGCLLTTTMDYPQFKTFVVFVAAADEFGLLVNCFDKLKEVARSCGCHTIESYSRRGMSKRLEPFGFEQASVVMELIL